MAREVPKEPGLVPAGGVNNRPKCLIHDALSVLGFKIDCRRRVVCDHQTAITARPRQTHNRPTVWLQVTAGGGDKSAISSASRNI